MRMIGRAMLWVALITPAIAFGSACAQDFETELSYGTWGVDLKAGEPSTRPGNDFFKYANGTWVEQTTIPADQSSVTLRSLMTDRIRSRLRAILETAARDASHEPSDISGKLGAFYKAFMDENAIDAVGSTPIDTILTAVRAVTAPEALGAMMGRAVHDFGGSFFDISIDVDAKDPSRYAVSLNQGGLGLPDRDYYLGEDSEFRKVKATYQRYIEQLLSLVGWPDPAGNAARIIALETRIAEAHWTKIEDREIDKTYNPMGIAELESFAPGFPWRSFLAEAKLGSTTRVIVSEKGAFPKIAAVFASTPVDTLRAWHAFKIASQAAPYLSKLFSDTYFDMYERTLLGQQQQEARWKRGVFVVSGDIDGDEDPLGHMGWAIGQLYAKHYFPATVKAQVNDLIGHLVRVFRERLNNRDWMDSATKAQALEKLDSFIVMVGYPDSLRRDYSQLLIRDDDPVGNVRRAADLDWDFHVNRLAGPVDRNDWSLMPQVNNATNAVYLRNLTIPAGVLQAPLFDPNADPAVNYGAFGAYAGHEITHGFDDQGRKIDAKGRIRDWWTVHDAKAFEARAANLAEQYSAFEPLPGLRVNGQLTMSENIADLGGLTLALDAYHSFLAGKAAPILDGLTGDQRVFLAWAQAWRGKLTDSALRNQVATDPHAPRQYRVNGVVRNIDEWYAAFNVKPGDKLYLMPEKRVRLW